MASMQSTEELRKIFQSHGGVMRTAELSAAKIYYADIQRLLKDGTIEQLRRGYYYLAAHDNLSEAALIVRLYPDAILCMDTALFYYRYSNRTPAFWHLAVSKDSAKGRFRIDYPFVKPYYIEPALLEIGLTNADIDGISIRIYDKERTICDCIKRRGTMDREIFNKAIQSYVNDSSQNIPNLMLYAKKLRVEKNVKDLIGVWL